MRVLKLPTTLFLLSVGVPMESAARPNAPDLFCSVYSDAPICSSGIAPCTTCHGLSNPNATNLNPYGQAIQTQLDGAEFTENLAASLRAIEGGDADDDGYDNVTEIALGSQPGDMLSIPTDFDCKPGDYNPDYNVCGRDPAYMFRRIAIDFCGRSPTVQEWEQFYARTEPQQVQYALDLQDACFDSNHWLGEHGVLWRLYYPVLQPLTSFDVFDLLPRAFNLVVYVNTDERDARDILRAEYAVKRITSPNAAPEYEQQEYCLDVYDWTQHPEVTSLGACNAVGEATLGCACSLFIPRHNVLPQSPTQLLPLGAPLRAGILTHAWYLYQFVMFAAIPRGAAAQTYRAFLGYEIANMEGLFEVQQRPTIQDWDFTGVTDPTCAQCHSVLDNLSYVYAHASFFDNSTTSIGLGYDPNRLANYFENDFPGISGAPRTSFILGQDVRSVRELAEVVVASQEFAQTHVLRFWRLLVGADPKTSDEIEEFTTLWRDFQSTHAFNTEAMLRQLVQTESYNAP